MKRRSAAQKRATARLVALNRKKKARSRKRAQKPPPHRRRRPVHSRKDRIIMAKKRRTTSKRTTTRKGRHHRRRRSGGGARGLMPSRDDMHLLAGAALYGYVESRAKDDKDFFLNKLPKPIDALGYTGNTALILWLAGHFTKNKYVKLAARGTALVAAYQMGRRGKAYSSGAEHFTVSGYDDDDVAEAIEQAAQRGALAGAQAQVGGLDPAAGIGDWPAGWG